MAATPYTPSSPPDALEAHVSRASAEAAEQSNQCRDRLTATDEYVAAMKAAAKIRESGKGE